MAIEVGMQAADMGHDAHTPWTLGPILPPPPPIYLGVGYYGGGRTLADLGRRGGERALPPFQY